MGSFALLTDEQNGKGVYLDDQEKVKAFEGKTVKVTGTLEWRRTWSTSRIFKLPKECHNPLGRQPRTRHNVPGRNDKTARSVGWLGRKPLVNLKLHVDESRHLGPLVSLSRS